MLGLGLDADHVERAEEVAGPGVSQEGPDLSTAADADVDLEGTVAVDTAAGARVVTPPPAPEESRWSRALREIATGNAIISVLAVILALLVGAIMIAASTM